jgi:hypothetical protein
MHLRLDDEILELEKRIAGRRAELRQNSHAAGRRALDGLGSPAALFTAAAVGFAAGGFGRRRRHNGNGTNPGEAARAAGLGSLLMTGASWFIRAQFGSPAGLARAVLDRMQARRDRPADPRLKR